MQPTDTGVRTAAAHLIHLTQTSASTTGTDSRSTRHRVLRLLSQLAPAACVQAGLDTDDLTVIKTLALALSSLIQLAGVRTDELVDHLDTLGPDQLNTLLSRAQEHLATDPTKP